MKDASMPLMPCTETPDATSALMKDPYRCISKRCRKYGVESGISVLCSHLGFRARPRILARPSCDQPRVETCQSVAPARSRRLSPHRVPSTRHPARTRSRGKDGLPPDCDSESYIRAGNQFLLEARRRLSGQRAFQRRAASCIDLDKLARSGNGQK